MERIQMTGKLSFSRIVQGFWRVCDWNMTVDELAAFIEGCMERGVDTFDTADIYSGGECEILVGKALRHINRSRYRIVSKGGICLENKGDGNFYDTSYEHIVEACHSTIKKLNCEYLDLYLIHREDPLIDPQETARAFETLKKEGSILEAGVSNFDPYKFNALNHFMRGTLRTNQIEWNPCCFEHFESGMMDLLSQLQIHPMIWSPLCGGKLFSSGEEIYVKARKQLEKLAVEYEVSVNTLVYSWILKHPVGAMPLVGSGSLSRLDEAVKALDIDLSREDWFKIYTASGQKIVR